MTLSDLKHALTVASSAMQVLNLLLKHADKCMESCQMSESLPMCVCVGVLYV